MPRNRHGVYVLRAEKEGENPRFEIFDTKLGWAHRLAVLKKQGYKFDNEDPRKIERISEDVYLGASPEALNDVINNALAKMGAGRAVEFPLESLGIKVDRSTQGDKKIITLSGDKAALYKDLLKEMGGKLTKNGWEFVNPDADFEETLATSIGIQNGWEIYKGQYLAQELTRQIAQMIHERGSRSHKIARGDEKGKDVYLGFEEDALTRVGLLGRAIAAGTAKTQVAKDMMKAFTGTDIEWSDYKKKHMPAGLTPDTPEYFKALFKIRQEYNEEVEKRRINSKKQPIAFKEAQSFIAETLRNTSTLERNIARIRGIAAIKFLSRPSSAIINLSAMLTNVPAAMNGLGKIPFKQTGSLLATTSVKFLNFAMGKMDKLTKEDQWLFGEISKRGWDESQLNEEAMRVGNTFAGAGMRKISEWAMFAFGLTERFNRAVTIAATYRGLASK